MFMKKVKTVLSLLIFATSFVVEINAGVTVLDSMDRRIRKYNNTDVKYEETFNKPLVNNNSHIASTVKIAYMSGRGKTNISTFISYPACCQNGWIPYENHCYFIGYETRLTFSAAWAYCNIRSSYLVRLDTFDENIFLKEYLKKTKAQHTWMGLTDRRFEGLWQWHDTKMIATFTDWVPNNPDNYNNEDCVHFHHEFGYKWNDIPCHEKLMPLCEKD